MKKVFMLLASCAVVAGLAMTYSCSKDDTKKDDTKKDDTKKDDNKSTDNKTDNAKTGDVH